MPAPVEVDAASGKHMKTVPAPGEFGSGAPFAVDSRRTARSLQVVDANEMTSHDRDLVADAESSIQERAGFENLEFNDGAWTYKQLVCPALPNHLFLRFTRHDGERDMSMFSVAIPRNGEGRVRIVPIVRKGYSLFSPAPIGALTIAAFNRIRREEKYETPADWVGTGLCYAALAGADPQAGELESWSSETGPLPKTIPPTLSIARDGGAVIQFADLSTGPQPREWKMTFDRKGKLLKASHGPAYLVRYRPHTLRDLDLNQVAAAQK